MWRSYMCFLRELMYYSGLRVRAGLLQNKDFLPLMRLMRHKRDLTIKRGIQEREFDRFPKYCIIQNKALSVFNVFMRFQWLTGIQFDGMYPSISSRILTMVKKLNVLFLLAGNFAMEMYWNTRLHSSTVELRLFPV